MASFLFLRNLTFTLHNTCSNFVSTLHKHLADSTLMWVVCASLLTTPHTPLHTKSSHRLFLSALRNVTYSQLTITFAERKESFRNFPAKKAILNESFAIARGLFVSLIWFVFVCARSECKKFQHGKPRSWINALFDESFTKRNLNLNLSVVRLW